MYRAVLATLVLLVLTGVTSRLDAKLVPYRKLTANQRIALAASENRLRIFDGALKKLDAERHEGKISRTEYGYEAHDLNAYIMAEARFQDDILVDNRPFPPEDVREVMENIARYAILVPGIIVLAVAKGLASNGASFTSH